MIGCEAAFATTSASSSVFFEEKEKYYTADKSFQDQIPNAGATDLVISIFWSKLGSELAPDLFGTMPDGKPYPGGAVYELMSALAAKRARTSPTFWSTARLPTPASRSPIPVGAT